MLKMHITNFKDQSKNQTVSSFVTKYKWNDKFSFVNFLKK